MSRSVLVMIHAGSGVAGLIIGLPALAPRLAAELRGRWIRQLYAGCVVALVASMAMLITVDWPHLQAGARTAFTGLAALGAVMVYRVVRADQQARTPTPGWQARYLDHIYFTYIALWIGFLIVPALNLPAPQVAVPIVVIATLAVGHTLIGRYRDRLLAPDAADPPIHPEASDGR